MSAFYAVNYGDRIELLTDRAIYTEDGTLIATREKVVRIGSIPCAVTARGAMEPLDAIGLYLEMVGAITGSFDQAMLRLGSIIAEMKDTGTEACEVIICGISEADGPVIAYFCSAPIHPGFEPFELYRMNDAELCGGPSPDAMADMPAAGITAESVKDGLAAKGADLMEVLRRKAGLNPVKPDLPPVFGIGGGVDLTVIAATGATTRRLRTWPDQIGEKIDPFAYGEIEAI
ncbi:hypothetical protein [Hoeflea sp.]|uniref:hypothetical protein n=1 Tax=Hoeflea sp. TaxID=1940281 RepID=UPI003B52F141